MEVVLKKKNATKIDLELTPNVYGLLLRDYNTLLSLFNEESSYQVLEKNTNQILLLNDNNIVLTICDTIEHLFRKDTVEDEFYYFNQVYHLFGEDSLKRFEYALSLVGLSKDILPCLINELSTSSKKLLHIAFTLYRNPKILILEEPFFFLDQKVRKRLLKLFKKMAQECGKIIFLCSQNVDDLYQECENFLIFQEEDILKFNSANELFQVDTLKKLKIELPLITLFSDKAIKNKKVHLGYHKDIRDLIKDIYKHVNL